MVQRMELEAARPPGICGSPLNPPISGYQPSVSVSDDVTPLSSEPVLFEDADNDSVLTV